MDLSYVGVVIVFLWAFNRYARVYKGRFCETKVKPMKRSSDEVE